VRESTGVVIVLYSVLAARERDTASRVWHISLGFQTPHRVPRSLGLSGQFGRLNVVQLDVLHTLETHRLLWTTRTFIVDVREPITPTTGAARTHLAHTHYGGAVSLIDATYRCRIES
jgi:hypothetical protein